MGLLNEYFSGKKLEIDEQQIQEHMNEYLNTIPEKRKLIESLHNEFTLADETIVNRLDDLLKIELIDIQSEDVEDKELITYLQKLEHDKRIFKIQRLEQCLAYAETKHQYLHQILLQLFVTLQKQMRLFHLLCQFFRFIYKPDTYPEYVQKLKNEAKIEEKIIEQINKRETFHKLFADLATGEVIIERIDGKQKRLLGMMQKGSPIGGITDQWVVAVMSTVMSKVEEYIAQGIIDSHLDADFEFVNSSYFEQFAEETILNLRGRTVRENTLKAFIKAFREMYNEKEKRN